MHDEVAVGTAQVEPRSCRLRQGDFLLRSRRCGAVMRRPRHRRNSRIAAALPGGPSVCQAVGDGLTLRCCLGGARPAECCEAIRRPTSRPPAADVDRLADATEWVLDELFLGEP